MIVEIAICPVCGTHVEYQGNDYGYLCSGEQLKRHEEATGVLTKGTFEPLDKTP